MSGHIHSFNEDSRTYFKKSMRQTGNQSMKLPAYGECSLFYFFLLLLFFKIVYAGYTFVYLITYLIELEGMNTVLSMIWLLMLSRVKEVMSGHARTMMVTCRVIS